MEHENEISSRLRKNLYKRWWSMMQRCYNEADKDYHLYGGRGVVVDQKWHTFEEFLKDAINLPGFAGENMLEGGKVLDKDVGNNNVYSSTTCCFVSKTDSNKMKPSQMLAFTAISPAGVEYESTNQSEFALAHGLRQGTISSCLRGMIKTHQGWTFAYK